MPNERSTWLRKTLSDAISILCERHGLQEAHKVALMELRRARQARSRRRFNFWATVASEIDGRKAATSRVAGRYDLPLGRRDQ